MLSYCVSSATTWCFFSTVHIAGTCLSLELELLAPCCSDRSFRLAGARRYKWKITIRAFRRDGLAESVEARCLRGQIHFLGGSHVSDHGVGPRGCHVLEELKIINVASDCEEDQPLHQLNPCNISVRPSARGQERNKEISGSFVTYSKSAALEIISNS